MPVVRPPIEPRSSPSLVDLGLLLTLSTPWGASCTFSRIGVATIPPLTLMATRTLVAGSLLAAWILSKRLDVPRDAGTWRRFAVQALLDSVVPFTLIAWAERSVDAGRATILNAASPILVFVVTWVGARHDPWTLHPSVRSLVALLALSVVSTALAFVIYFRLIRTLGAIGTTAQAYLRVPIGTAIGIVFLGESLTSTAWRGLACVVVGVAAMTMPARPAPHQR